MPLAKHFEFKEKGILTPGPILITLKYQMKELLLQPISKTSTPVISEGYLLLALGIAIPTISGWYLKRRTKRYLNRYITLINSISDRTTENRGESINRLNQIEREIENLFSIGKINETDYRVLDDKIAEVRGKGKQPV